MAQVKKENGNCGVDKEHACLFQLSECHRRCRDGQYHDFNSNHIRTQTKPICRDIVEQPAITSDDH